MSRREDRSTLIALIGHGVGPSLTPKMHELEGARHGIRYIYRRVEFTGDADPTAQLEAMLDSAEAFGFDGLNLTHPVKQTAVALLDDLSWHARMVGAVNTVIFEDGRRIGHNTDVTGFGASLQDALGRRRRGSVVVLGAGGAGSAVAHALAIQGVERLRVLDVDGERAARLAHQVHQMHDQPVSAGTPDDLSAQLLDAEGLVNATPFGMAHQPGSPVEEALLHPGLWVCDVVYRPAETALLRAGRAAGCLAVPGLGMAMHQAADAFEIFTGEAADRRAMLTDLNRLVEAEKNPAPAPG